MNILAAIDWQPLLEGGDGPPVLLFLTMGIVAIAVVVAIQWRKVRIGEAEVSLKMRMIERGYSPEQVVQILQGSVGTDRLGPPPEKEFLTPAST